jgi:hypothetical protein
MFPIKNGLKEGDVLLSLLFNFVLEYSNCYNSTVHIGLLFMVMMLIYGVTAYTP